ncbi:MAG: radical SAM protein [Candidatus Omnitrophota bacterium]
MSSHNYSFINKEVNTVFLKKNARFKIALVYPNTYHVGMSNLGFQSIYNQWNSRPDTLCERFFYEPAKKQLLSVESRSQLNSYDVVAFSLSYELDYVHFLSVLRGAGLLGDRTQRSIMPLIIVGGVVTSFNCLPLSEFCDVVFVGEAEESINEFMDILANYAHMGGASKKEKFLTQISQMPGVFVSGYSLTKDIAPRIVQEVDLYPTSSRVLTAHTEFSNIFLTEISRGCPWGCKFCATGSVFNKFRPRSLDVLTREISMGMKYSSRIGLIGAAISDHPQIEGLVTFLKQKNAKISVSSLRIETVKKHLLEALSETGQRTITFAPEAGSEQLRRYLKKNISDEEIMEKINMAKKAGIKKIKLYFMVGLPVEEQKDIEAIVGLIKSSARILPVKTHIGIFVPKPKTPFAGEKIADKKTITARMRYLQRNLAAAEGIEFSARKVREAMQEAQFSSADENFFVDFAKNH